MTDGVLTPEFEQVLARDVLPGKLRLLPAHQALSLRTLDPESVRMGHIESDRYVDVDDIEPESHDRALITMPASPRICAWYDDHEPMAPLHKLKGHLHDECGLATPDDFMLMSLHDRVKQGNKLSLPRLRGFLLSIDKKDFHDMAMDMLRRLADPRMGAALLHDGDREQYRAQLADPLSETSQIVAHIIVNAAPSIDELDDLRHSTVRKGNFEFCARLMECGDLLHPGFAAARVRKAATPGGPGLTP